MAAARRTTQRPIKAIVPGGISMKLLTADQIDTPLDYESVQAAGSLARLGGHHRHRRERTSMVDVARRTLSFYREESCGKCTPCREGTGWLEDDPACGSKPAAGATKTWN